MLPTGAMGKLVAQLLAISAVVLTFALTVQKVILDRTDPYRCNALRDGGRWLEQTKSPSGYIRPHHWQPPGCILHEYNAHEIEQCLDCSRLLFVGDSNVRQLFWAAAMRTNKTKTDDVMLYAEKHSNVSFEHGCSKLEFWWDPYLNSSLLQDEIVASDGVHDSGGLLPLRRHGPPTTIVVGGGLWHARYLGKNYLTAFKNNIDTLFNLSRNRDTTKLTTLPAEQRSLLLVMPVLWPYYDMLDKDRNATLTPERLSVLNEYLLHPSTSSAMEILWSFSSMLQPQVLAYQDNGIHLLPEVVNKQVDIVLNLRCNAVTALQHYPFDKTCCAATIPYNMVQMVMLILALLAIVLGVTTAASTVLGFKSPGLEWQQRISALTVMSSACIYCFLADRTHSFQEMQKTTEQAAFWWMFSFIIVLGVLTMGRSTTANHMSEKVFNVCTTYSPYLSRDQTEEWKGWMQFVILLYHYFGMSKVLWVYQFIRLLVASYLFMTGFGHALFFLKNNDFSIRRIATVTIRLNLLSVILAYTMRTDWDFYYFPALSSFWFFVTSLTMRLWRWRRAGGIPIFVSAFLVRFAINHPGLLEMVVETLHLTCRMNINVQELRFRVSLDIYIVYVGMLVAIGYVEFGHLTSFVPSWATVQFRRRPRLFKAITQLALLIIIGLYVILAAQFSDKYAYNKWHAVVSPCPVFAFVALRNATPLLREHHSYLFAWLGRCSLETFILQYHILLAANTKGLLRLGLGFDDAVWWGLGEKVEVAIITMFFLWASWGVSYATTVLTNWLVGPAQVQGAHERRTRGCVGLFRRLTSRLGLKSRLGITLVVLVICNWVWI